MSTFITYQVRRGQEQISVSIDSRGAVQIVSVGPMGTRRHDSFAPQLQVERLFATLARSGWQHWMSDPSGHVVIGVGHAGQAPVLKMVRPGVLPQGMELLDRQLSSLTSDLIHRAGWDQAPASRATAPMTSTHYDRAAVSEEDDIDLGWFAAPALGAAAIFASQVALVTAVLLGFGSITNALEDLAVLLPLLLGLAMAGLGIYLMVGMGIGYWVEHDARSKAAAAAGIIAFVNAMASIFDGSFGFGVIAAFMITTAICRAGASGGAALRKRHHRRL